MSQFTKANTEKTVAGTVTPAVEARSNELNVAAHAKRSERERPINPEMGTVVGQFNRMVQSSSGALATAFYMRASTAYAASVWADAAKSRELPSGKLPVLS